MELSKLVKSLIKKLYKPALLLITLQGLFIALFLYDNRGRIKSQIIKYDIIEIITNNSSLDTLYFKDYVSYLRDILFSFSKINTLERIDLSVNFDDFTLLECSRLDKVNCTKDGWIKGPVLFHDDQFYDVKIRSKGDRKIHRQNIKKMSFKVDIRGKKRLFGMEEFSLQLPVIRNYSMEPLIAKLLKKEDILTPRHKYVKLFMNGEYLGIRHLEESFGRELIEINKRRYGPIFSLDEDSGHPFINNRLDLHDRKNWINNKNLSHSALSALRYIQKNPNKVNDYFDIKKWAKYFAMLDAYNMMHGTLPKSVKFFLNPVTGVFEPIFFDGHYGLGLFDKYLLSDVIRINNSLPECRYTCSEIEFYRMFFGNGNKVNSLFLNEYLINLKKFSSERYINNQFKKEWDDLSNLRGIFYREFLKRDQAYHEGIFPHVAPKTRIYKRLKDIREKIEISENEIPNHSFDFSNGDLMILNENSKIPQKYNLYCQSEKPILEKFLINKVPLYLNIKEIDEKCNFNNLKFSIKGKESRNFIKNLMVSNLKIDRKLNNLFINNYQRKENNKDTITFEKGKNFIKNDREIVNKKVLFNKGSEICLENNSIFLIKNSEIIIKGDSKEPTFFKSCNSKFGSIIIENSEVKLGVLKTENLSSPNINLRSLYGGLNIINSNLNGNSIYLFNSNSEDAINFINSDIILNYISFRNIKSDALDSDASNLDLKKIYCENIGNDCLDLSFSNSIVDSIYAKSVKDKVISIGENSNLKLNKLTVKNSEIAIVAKDSSSLLLNQFNFDNVKIPISAYVKKQEFEAPKVLIKSLNNSLNEKFLDFVSKDSRLTIDNKKFLGLKDSSEILEILYGNEYGVKTERR